MSPTISELQDVLDWQAATVLEAIDEEGGATVEAASEAAGLDRGTVETRCQQLQTLGLITEADGEKLYELTGSGHGAIGAGFLTEYELLGDDDIDDLAGEVAALFERRDDLEAAVDDLREDAIELRDRARRQFGDRDDVAAEFEPVLADVDALAEALSTE